MLSLIDLPLPVEVFDAQFLMQGLPHITFVDLEVGMAIAHHPAFIGWIKVIGGGAVDVV